MSPHVARERTGAVLRLTLDRPDKKNALTDAMYAALAAGPRRGRRRAGDPCGAADRRGRRLHGGQRHRRLHGRGERRHGAGRAHRAPLSRAGRGLSQAAGRRRAWRRHRRRHDDAAALRLRHPGRERPPRRALCRARRGAGGRLQPAAAGLHRPPARLRDVRSGRGAGCRARRGLGARQPRRRRRRACRGGARRRRQAGRAVGRRRGHDPSG